MCGDSGFDEDIDGILIPHPDRVPRVLRNPTRIIEIDAYQFHEGVIYLPSLNDVDLADSYVPFDSSVDAQGIDAGDKENDQNSGILALLVVGFLFSVLALMEFVAKGEAIPSVAAVSLPRSIK